MEESKLRLSLNDNVKAPWYTSGDFNILSDTSLNLELKHTLRKVITAARRVLILLFYIVIRIGS